MCATTQSKATGHGFGVNRESGFFSRKTTASRRPIVRDWELAPLEQQVALIAEFRTLLMRTYSAVLANYFELRE